MTHRALPHLAALCALSALAGPASAAPLASWSFNSDDGQVNTGSLVPDAGAGTLALVGGATAFFTSGSPSDPATFPLDSSWSVGGFPAQGTASGTTGFTAFVSTAGYTGVTLSFDYRNQPSANKWFLLQASGDGGGSWNDVATLGVEAADTWYAGTWALALPEATDNPLFGVRLVAIFEPGTSAYEASEAGYNGDFGLQIDRLTLSATPVPETAAWLSLLAGLGMLGALRARRP